MLDGEAENAAATVEEAIGVRVQPPAERALGVERLDGAGQPSLDAVQARGEPERLGGGRGLPREEVGARGALLEAGLDEALSDGGIPHPALRDTSPRDAAAPTAC